MTQAVLVITGHVVPCPKCAPLTISEINSTSEKNKRDKFDAAILKLYGDSMTVPVDKPKPVDLELSDLVDNENAPIHLTEESKYVKVRTVSIARVAVRWSLLS